MSSMDNKDYEESTYMEKEIYRETEAEETEMVETEVEEAEVEEAEVEENPMDERREFRRKRRARNEMMAYLATFLVLVLVASAGFMGVRAIRGDGDASTETGATESTDDIHNMLDDILSSETALPTEVVVEVTPEEKLDEYIDTVISGMTLAERVAGLFITSPEELTGVAKATRAGAGTETALKDMPVGGLVYYRKNMESKDQMMEMLSNTKNYSKKPIFLAVNEGGDSASSVQNSAISVPDVTKPGDIQSAEDAYALGSTIGGYLSELRFNVNFAPTADILLDADASVASYCFGGDAATNASFVAEYVKGLKEQGISAALKTFPGTGHLTSSTENGTVNTSKTKDEYQAEFSVFKAGIDAGADFVMVSHIVAPELSGGVDPCSMSPSVVTDILRSELGYNGIIITEPMTNKAITEYYTSDEAAVAALKAGCDMILLPEDLEAAYQGILKGVADGVVSEARINDSLKRVYRVKFAYKLGEFAE